MPQVPTINNSGYLYSPNWRREVFVGSLPFFDIMVDKNYLSLIKMPEQPLNFKQKIVSILSFFLGPIIAMGISDARKNKYYKNYRLSWLSLENKLISNDYEKGIFLKIPVDDLSPALIVKKNKLVITYAEQKITLLRKKSSLRLEKSIDAEFTRFKEYVDQ